MPQRSMLGRTFDSDDSDEHLIEEIHRQFDHPALIENEVEITCREGEVVLRGFAPNYEAKALAEGLAKAVPGVRSVTNEVQVKGGRVS